jgi:Neprosin
MTQKPERPIGIIPHYEFIKDVDSAHYDGLKADPRIQVRSAAHLKEMQAHIKQMYHGVTVVHSFADASGHVFDCIPIEQQPSVRGKAHYTVPKPPDISALVPPEHAQSGQSPTPVQPQLGPDKKDRHGNVMACPVGTIPMRRLTLEQLARYETLQDFFRKDAPAVAMVTRPSAPDTTDEGKNHRYAYTRQTVDNVGGHSFLNVWQPTVRTPDQRMSLSQEWYSGGSGVALQTAEAGWQVLPDKYGHSQPVLFIYWTPDGYATGNYNLDAPAFVQTNPGWAIGGAIGPVSTAGAQQYELEISFYLTGGNWWLYLGGGAAANAVGYYPTSIYKGGQLASNAQVITYGGETVCRAVGWGDMGSGKFASAGWQNAAYQRDIYYYPAAGGSAWANLLPTQDSPGCYTVTAASAPDPWNIYFFFGGPGGTDC